MSGIITKNFRHNNAEQFYESFGEAAPTRLYVYIGKVTAFANESVPPTPVDRIELTEYDQYRDMIAMKRVTATDSSYCVVRYNWTTGNVYREYTDDDANIFPTTAVLSTPNTFFVMTTAKNVYKCIDNARGTASTIMPTGTGTTITTTADGYRWKYMFTVTAGDELKFLTYEYIPVKTLTEDDGSAQWQVQDNAANGAIHHVKMTANGSGYLWTTNTFYSVTNSTTVILNTNAGSTSGMYGGSTIFISSGTGAGQIRNITNYDGSARIATVNSAFTILPTTSSTYIVGPKIIIKGDSGEAAINRATAYVENCNYGQIRKITMITNGFNYSEANTIISDNYGTGVNAHAIISPHNGHGAEPVRELGAHNVLIDVRLTQGEGGLFPVSNDYRIVGLLRNPRLRSGALASNNVIDQCINIHVTSLNGTLTDDEDIVGSTSGARAKFVYFANTNSAMTSGAIRCIRIRTTGTGGKFVPNETVTGGTSGFTATVSSLVMPTIKEYTGDIIYNENTTFVTRSSVQTEDVKIIVRF